MEWKVCRTDFFLFKFVLLDKIARNLFLVSIWTNSKIDPTSNCKQIVNLKNKLQNFINFSPSQAWSSPSNTYWIVQMVFQCLNSTDSCSRILLATLYCISTCRTCSPDDVVHRNHFISPWCRHTIAVARKWLHLRVITQIPSSMWIVKQKLPSKFVA